MTENQWLQGYPAIDTYSGPTIKAAPGTTTELLTERSTTHGDFATNARISQALKDVFQNQRSGTLNAVHREALDMIALKISRILSGHASFKDHWDDIAGYAKLAANACEDH